MTSEKDREIERAIKFLVYAVDRANNKTKPVILHSIRVGLYLDGLGYPLTVVLAGILHDTVEASDVTLDHIREEFGEDVAGLVGDNTNDESLPDKRSQYRDTFARCLNDGEPALAIKAADLFDNSLTWAQEEDTAKRAEQMTKIRYFLEVSAPAIGTKSVWNDLDGRFQSIIG